MSGDSGRQVHERVELLELTGPRDRQQTFDGAFTLVASRPEHDLPPLNNARLILPVIVDTGEIHYAWHPLVGQRVPILYTDTVAASWWRSADARWLASVTAGLDARPGRLAPR